MASLVFNHGSYFAVFSISGKKHWQKVGNASKPQAKQILKQLDLEFARNRPSLTEITAPLFVTYGSQFCDVNIF